MQTALDNELALLSVHNTHFCTYEPQSILTILVIVIKRLFYINSKWPNLLVVVLNVENYKSFQKLLVLFFVCVSVKVPNLIAPNGETAHSVICR